MARQSPIFSYGNFSLINTPLLRVLLKALTTPNNLPNSRLSGLMYVTVGSDFGRGKCAPFQMLIPNRVNKNENVSVNLIK